MLRFALIVALSIAAAGCAPTTQRPTVDTAASAAEAKLQRAMAFESAQAQRHRLNDVGHRILVAGTDLCGDKIKPTFGLTFTTAIMFQGDTQAAARDAGFSDMIDVTGIVTGGPAALAGLRAGDRLVSAGGSADFAPGKPGMEAIDTAFKGAKVGEPLSIVVLRNGERVPLAVTPIASCNYPTVIATNPQLNAFADGEKIVIYSGMMKFAQTDEELALVVGHELGHNLRDHIGSKRTNAVIGAVLDGILGALLRTNTGGIMSNAAANAYSTDFEAEADYVGLYLAARAGYQIDDAPKFWRRMAVENPNAISHASTHPATSERFVALQAAIKEIDGKRAAGQPLVPNEQKQQTAQPVSNPQ